LFLDDRDPVSVHVLACAGGEIAEHLTRKKDKQPFSSHALATFPDLDANKIRRLRNQIWNAFKHATTQKGKERDDRRLLKRFSDLQNDHALLLDGTFTRWQQKRCRLRRKSFRFGTLRSIPKSLTVMSIEHPTKEFFRTCQSSRARCRNKHCAT